MLFSGMHVTNHRIATLQYWRLSECVLSWHVCHESSLGLPRHESNLRVLQCVAVCCSVLQRVAVCCIVVRGRLVMNQRAFLVTNPFSVCCSVLQCVAACCSALQCCMIQIRHEPLGLPRHQSILSVLQCVEVCCSVLQCVAAFYEAGAPQTTVSLSTPIHS